MQEPAHTAEFPEAQRGKATNPKLWGTSPAAQRRSPGPWDEAVTHYSLTLRGTVNPAGIGFTRSMFWNTWLVPKMRCRVPFGTGFTHGFGMRCEGAGSSSRAS